MAGISLNRHELIGRLTADPTFAVVGENKVERASMKIAVDREFDKDKTDFFNLTAFGPIVDKFIKPFVKKGMLCYVAGPNQFERYKDKDGNERISSSIIVRELRILSGKNSGSSDEVQVVVDENVLNGTENTPVEASKDGIDDTLPF